MTICGPQLLERDPQKRLGWKAGGGGLQDIKNHPWFREIDWDALEKKEVPPPFVPDVSDAPSFTFILDTPSDR